MRIRRLMLAIISIALSSEVNAQVFNDPAPAGNVQALEILGRPVPGDQIVVNVTAPPGSTCFIFISGARGSLQTPIGEVLLDLNLLIPQFVTLVADSSGTARSTPLVLPQVPPGTPFFTQTLINNASTGTTQLSNLTRVYVARPANAPIPRLTLNAPPRVVGSASVTIDGTATEPGSTIVIEGGQTPVTVTANLGPAGDEFNAVVPLVANRINRLNLTETTPAGLPLPPVPVSVTQDSQAPILHIDFPASGTRLNDPELVAAGRVADTLSGFNGLTVTVSDGVTTMPAVVDRGIGTNGTWMISAFPLGAPGTTTNFVVTATDGVGNQSSQNLVVTREALAGASMQRISGNEQAGAVDDWLPAPIVIEVRRGNGQPFCNKVVTFEVDRSNGVLSTTPGGGSAGTGDRLVQVLTDQNGLAQVYWRLGTDAGCGNNRVRVTSRDINGFVAFCASAHPGPATQINVGLGDGQANEVGAVLPIPFRVWVSDGCNPISNAPVLFEILQGDGALLDRTGNPLSGVTIQTSATGHAEVGFSLGLTPGNNVVKATLLGNGASVTYQALGIMAVTGSPTTFEGVVLDNAETGIGGANCWVSFGDGTTSQVVQSLPSGAFEIPLTRSGAAHLHVEGRSATTLGGVGIPAGSFPDLEFEVTVVDAAVNIMPMPVLLPQLNPRNERIYDGISETILTVEGIDGLEMRVAPGSMTLADGTPAPPGTVIALNQVHVDKIPMPMTDGASPPFAWTLQPAGATFDPPISIQYPNMSGLPPGAIAYFLTFDHDTAQFEIVSSATVSTDGAFINSDPGSGLTLAGWGCNCPPYFVSQDCENCTTTCTDRGRVNSGMSVTSPGGSSPSLGENVIISGPVTDTGGWCEQKCPDMPPERIEHPAAGVAVSYTITPPCSTSAPPSIIPIIPDASGNYTIAFNANEPGVWRIRVYGVAQRACAPFTTLIDSYDINVDSSSIDIQIIEVIDVNPNDPVIIVSVPSAVQHIEYEIGGRATQTVTGPFPSDPTAQGRSVAALGITDLLGLNPGQYDVRIYAAITGSMGIVCVADSTTVGVDLSRWDDSRSISQSLHIGYSGLVVGAGFIDGNLSGTWELRGRNVIWSAPTSDGWNRYVGESRLSINTTCDPGAVAHTCNVNLSHDMQWTGTTRNGGGVHQPDPNRGTGRVTVGAFARSGSAPSSTFTLRLQGSAFVDFNFPFGSGTFPVWFDLLGQTILPVNWTL